jgi:hypothetical protein
MAISFFLLGLLVTILLMAIGGYYIERYYCLLMVISGYYINGYWWVLY